MTDRKKHLKMKQFKCFCPTHACTIPTADIIVAADGATMKLDNQKKEWKGVCVYQEENGDPLNCPVRALGRHSDTPSSTITEDRLPSGI